MTTPKPDKPKHARHDDIEGMCPGRHQSLWGLRTAHTLDNVHRPGFLRLLKEAVQHDTAKGNDDA